MSTILHHMAALGWGWVALFVGLSVVALACIPVAARVPNPRLAWSAFVASAVAAGGSVLTTTVVTGVGIAHAFAADPSKPASEQAKVLAEGISVAMNGAAMGLIATLVSGGATLACLGIAGARLKRNRGAPPTAPGA